MESTQGTDRMGVVLPKQEEVTDTIRRDVRFKKKTNKMCPIQYLIIAQSKQGEAAIWL